jgi:hypothetical protein
MATRRVSRGRLTPAAQPSPPSIRLTCPTTPPSSRPCSPSCSPACGRASRRARGCVSGWTTRSAGSTARGPSASIPINSCRSPSAGGHSADVRGGAGGIRTGEQTGAFGGVRGAAAPAALGEGGAATEGLRRMAGQGSGRDLAEEPSGRGDGLRAELVGGAAGIHSGGFSGRWITTRQSGLCVRSPSDARTTFFGSDVGGETTAVLYTFTQTCQALGVEPWHYLRSMLARLSSHSPERLAELLPDEWARAQRGRDVVGACRWGRRAFVRLSRLGVLSVLFGRGRRVIGRLRQAGV